MCLITCKLFQLSLLKTDETTEEKKGENVDVRWSILFFCSPLAYTHTHAFDWDRW